MPARIEDKIRKQVVDQWLSGDTRDEIAASCALGNGSVSSIVKEWQSALEGHEFESVRRLAVDAKRRGFEFKDAATIIRLYARVQKEGIKITEIEEFLANVEDLCLDEGISPKQIVSIAKQLLALSRTENASPEKVPEMLEQKLKELKDIKNDIEIFTKEKEKSDQERLSALKQKDITEDAIQEYIKLGRALKDRGLSIHNVTAVLTLLDNCQKLDNDPTKIVAKQHLHL